MLKHLGCYGLINVAEIPGLTEGRRVVVRYPGPNRKIAGSITDPDFDDLYTVDIDMILKYR